MSDNPHLPDVITGQITDDSRTPIADNLGSSMVGSSSEAILNAIYALATEFRHTMATQSEEFAAALATFVSNNTAIVAALDAIKAEIVAGTNGNVTADQVTALQTAVEAQSASVAVAQGLVATPVVPPAA